MGNIANNLLNCSLGFPFIHMAMNRVVTEGFLGTALKTAGIAGAAGLTGAALANPDLASSALHTVANTAENTIGQGSISAGLHNAANNSPDMIKNFKSGVSSTANNIANSVKSITSSPSVKSITSSPSVKSISNQPITRPTTV